MIGKNVTGLDSLPLRHSKRFEAFAQELGKELICLQILRGIKAIPLAPKKYNLIVFEIISPGISQVEVAIVVFENARDYLKAADNFSCHSPGSLCLAR